MPTTNGANQNGNGNGAVLDQVVQQGSALKEQTANKLDDVKDRVLVAADERKGEFAERAHSAVDTVGKIADDLAEDGLEKPADWLRQAADAMDRMVSNVENRDTQQLATDATRAFRSQPLVFAGAMLGLGFAAARLMSAAKQPTQATFNNSEPDWPTLNNPAPYARMDGVELSGSPYGDQ